MSAPSNPSSIQDPKIQELNELRKGTDTRGSICWGVAAVVMIVAVAFFISSPVGGVLGWIALGCLALWFLNAVHHTGSVMRLQDRHRKAHPPSPSAPSPCQRLWRETCRGFRTFGQEFPYFGFKGRLISSDGRVA